MVEKIIIKGTPHKAVKGIKIAMIVLFIVSVIICLCLLGEYNVDDYNFYSGWYTRKKMGFEAAFDGNGSCLMLFILACMLFVSAIILLVVFIMTRKCSIVITEKNVRGTAIFGKEVVLPLYMISAYSTRNLFSTIAVATSSGITKFSMIENYKEIAVQLAKLINERQENTTANIPNRVQQNNSLDEIIKLKELLDKNIITQEEFDAKKKQVLGL